LIVTKKAQPLTYFIANDVCMTAKAQQKLSKINLPWKIDIA
jgi:hypothetical protein